LNTVGFEISSFALTPFQIKMGTEDSIYLNNDGISREEHNFDWSLKPMRDATGVAFVRKLWDPEYCGNRITTSTVTRWKWVLFLPKFTWKWTNHSTGLWEPDTSTATERKSTGPVPRCSLLGGEWGHTITTNYL
jgi:hypothetical protein